MTTDQSKNQCPFCDHENLADAKFCSACGAVLHLVPCAKCGAVNEKTAASCYRCHTEFTPAAADALPAPQETTHEAAVAATASASVKAAPSQRPPLIVFGIVLIAFAVASYFAYRQRTVTPIPATAGSGTTPGAAPAANVGVGEISKNPDASPQSAGTIPVTTPATTPTQTPAQASAGGNAGTPPARPAVAAEPAPDAAAPAAEQTASPRTGSRQSRRSAAGGVSGGQSIPPAQCTEAIAALGLCTPQSNQRRQ